MEERLKLATDASAAFDRTKDELEKVKKEFQDYKERVAVEGSNASPVKMDAAIGRANKISIEAKKKLVDALMMRGMPPPRRSE